MSDEQDKAKNEFKENADRRKAELDEQKNRTGNPKAPWGEGKPAVSGDSQPAPDVTEAIKNVVALVNTGGLGAGSSDYQTKRSEPLRKLRRAYRKHNTIDAALLLDVLDHLHGLTKE